MKKILFLTILLLVVSCEGKDSSSSSQSDNSKAPVQDESVTTQFMTLVNNHRKSLGLSAIKHSSKMADIAYGHSEDMARKSVSFGHDGFSARCSLARNAMGGGNLCAENVAMGQKTAQAVFTAWMNSSGHRANIENSRVTHSGLGIAKSSDGTLYWTHLFLEL